MTREPASIRYKNPGAMWPNKIATKWGSKRWIYLNDHTGQGGGGHGNKIAIFDNWVDGISAQLDLWRSSPNYRNKRFADAIRIWSGGNHVPDYIAHVKARVPGMTENTVMNDTFWRGPMGPKFLLVQASHEAGKLIPAAPEDWIEAQRRVFNNKDRDTVVHGTVAGGGIGGATAITTLQAASPYFSFEWWEITGLIVGLVVLGAVVIYFVSKRMMGHE